MSLYQALSEQVDLHFEERLKNLNAKHKVHNKLKLDHENGKIDEIKITNRIKLISAYI